jgi:hypothetical protein
MVDLWVAWMVAWKDKKMAGRKGDKTAGWLVFELAENLVDWVD